MDNAVEVIGIDKGLMGEKIALQIAPGPLDVVQLWGVFRQPFDHEPEPRGEGGARSLAGMNGSVVEDEDDGFVVAPRARPVDRIEAAQKIDEIAAALGVAGADGQLVGGKVEGANDRPFLRLAWRFDAQIAAAFGPGPSEIGVGERLRLVAEQQDDVARRSLLLQQPQAQAGAVGRIDHQEHVTRWMPTARLAYRSASVSGHRLGLEPRQPVFSRLLDVRHRILNSATGSF